MGAVNLSLTPEEHALLVQLLETALGETRVEVHRTHTSPDFRDFVKHQEQLLRGLLRRLQATAS
jgi:hypothetical protein